MGHKREKVYYGIKENLNNSFISALCVLKMEFFQVHAKEKTSKFGTWQVENV